MASIPLCYPEEEWVSESQPGMVGLMDARNGMKCRSCRGRGWKSVRPRRLVVVRSVPGEKQATRAAVCPFCKGTGERSVTAESSAGSGLAC